MGLFELILLDTHVVIWLSEEPSRLSLAAREAIQAARSEGGLAISAVTLFEVANLITRKRISVIDPEAFLNEIVRRFVVRHISAPIAIASARFVEPYPRDPMDRLIGATALVEKIPLVTADERIQQAGQIQTIW